MKKINILIFIFCLQALSFKVYALEPRVRHVITNTELSTGLNPVDSLPAEGSNWEVRLSDFFAGGCGEFNEHIYYQEDLEESFVQYIGPSVANCSGVSHEDDINSKLTWTDLGIVQEDFFGTELLECNLEEINCDISQELTKEEQIFSSLTPEDGGDGTESSFAEIFAYDSPNFVLEATSGSGGSGGVNNLNIYSSRRYCIDLKDYSTGSETIYAKNPIVKIIDYNWTPIYSSEDGSDGESKSSVVKQSRILNGLDYSQLYWLGSDNVTNGTQRE